MYIVRTGRDDGLQGELVGAGCDAIPTDRPAPFEFENLGFVRPLFNQQSAAMKLAAMTVPSVLAQIVLSPITVQCPTPRDELIAGDLYPDDCGVPLNEFQFNAIRRIGTDRTVLVQGPPGTGKSSTIWNGIRYRLPPGKRAIVSAVTNQAVAAVLEKFITARSYRPLLDPCPQKVARQFADAAPAAAGSLGFSFFFFGNRDRFRENFPEFERCGVAALLAFHHESDHTSRNSAQSDPCTPPPPPRTRSLIHPHTR